MPVNQDVSRRAFYLKTHAARMIRTHNAFVASLRAKRSNPAPAAKTGLLRRYAPRNDEAMSIAGQEPRSAVFVSNDPAIHAATTAPDFAAPHPGYAC